jgi:hypothetical protein
MALGGEKGIARCLVTRFPLVVQVNDPTTNRATMVGRIADLSPERKPGAIENLQIMHAHHARTFSIRYCRSAAL